MKNKYLLLLKMLTRYTLTGIVAQTIFFSLLIADNSTAQQNLSVKEVSVTVNLRNATISDFFAFIEARTDFKFAYHESDLRAYSDLNLKSKNISVAELLMFLSKEANLKFKQVNRIIHVSKIQQNEKADEVIEVIIQTRNVTGTVTSFETDEPLPGVNVIEKGTSNGTVTDIDGNYSLNVSDGAALIFSFVGYTREEVAVGNRSVIDMSMTPDITSLEEIVVIGYGTQKKSDLTGAISQIDPTDMEEKLSSNMADLLRSNLAGLHIPISTNPKGSIDMDNVLIRGTNSLLASNTPLVVLDGMIYDGDLANISPSDIERIDVMKDASSAAIYGSRAANGVIIITTKKGAAGAPTINFSLNTGLATAASLRPVYGPEEYLNMRRVWSEENLPRDEAGYYSNPSNLPSGVSQEDWMAYDNATGDPTNVWLARIGLFQTEINNYNAGRTVNWRDELFQTGLRQDYLLSISGGDNALKYYWSANYTDNEGFAIGQEYSSIRSRINLESKIANFLTIGMNTQFANRNESSIPVDFMSYVWNSPYGSIYQSDGETLKYLTYDFNTSFNPFYDREYIDRYHKFTDLDARLFAIVDLPLGFSYQINYIPTYSNVRFYDHERADSEAIANGGQSSRINTTYLRWTVDNILKWNKSFGAHSFDLTLLANAEQQRIFKDSLANSQYFPSDVLGYHGVQTGQDPRVLSNDQTYTRDALMARLNYTLASRYLLTMAIRRDGYSAFGQANPYGYFPTVAAGWILSEENFFNVGPIDFLKLRLSWGANGNSDIGTYSALATMESRKFLYSSNGQPMSVSELRLARMANTGLQWEKTTAYNLGIDFEILGSMINGTLEGYMSETTNLLVDRKLPSVTGYGSVAANLGQINNRGVEITLSSGNLNIGNNLAWRTSFNSSLNRNKIVSLYGDMVEVLDEEGNVIGQEEASDYENEWFIGQPIDVIWDFDSDGIWQVEEADEAESLGYFPGQFKNVDVDNDGDYDSDDRQFLGNRNPQFRWNLTNTFTLFENLTFSFSLYGHHGHLGNFGDYAGSAMFSTGNGLAMPYWTAENRSSEYAGMRGAGGTNYRSLSFVRLSDISLGYAFPQNIIRQLNLKSLRVYGSVNNVYVFTNWPGWDPETWTPDNAGGPSPRYFNLGVNVSL